MLGVTLPLSTATRVHVWSSERQLWVEAVRHSPEKPRPWINLGAEYGRDGAELLAAEAFQRAADLSLQPARLAVEGPMRGRHVALMNLAILRANAGRYDEALALIAEIQPRAESGSLVQLLERQWRDEQQHGGPWPDF